MERKSPRAGGSARAGKSIAADLSAYTSSGDGAPVQRKAGLRRTDGGVGYPLGCPGLSAKSLAICSARLRGSPCLLCVRSGKLSLPAEWPQGAMNIVGSPSVQALRSGKDGVWYVVCFVGGCRVDPRYPVIACTTRAQAVDLGKKRARQISPGGVIEERGPGDYRVGSLILWVLGDGR